MKTKYFFLSKLSHCIFVFSFILLSFQTLAVPSETKPTNILIEALEREQPESKMYFATLATTDSIKPSVRMIQVSMNESGLIQFYTHANTHKVSDFKNNHPHAALNYWLPNTKLQVTVNGTLTLIDRKYLDVVWTQMPRKMQIQFIASDHKSELPSSDYLIEKFKYLDTSLPNNIPMPDEFVGFNFQPNKFTFYKIKSGTFSEKLIAEQAKDKWIWRDTQP